MRILHVFRAPVGGLFRHVVDLTRIQAAAGHRVGIVCDANTGGERAEQALADLAPHLALGVVRLPMRRNPHPSDLAALMGVRERVRAVGADVLHGHGAKGGVYARLCPVSDGLIRAYTPHGGSYNYRPGTMLHRLYMGIERQLVRATDVFLFESEFVASRHRTYAGGPVRLARIVHNGIAEAEFEPVGTVAAAFDLVYVGELREAKGLPFLLQALSRLKAEGRRLRLLMVGSGPDTDSLTRLADELGVRDAIAFEPPQPIRPVLGRGRLMVVPSLAESLPYVVLEAAAACQPLVATNVGGIPEIFGAFAGSLVPPRDVGALSGAIARILDEPAEVRDGRAKALSDSVRARFSMNRMGADVLCGYAAALASRPAVAQPAPATA
ncbi:glycosyltransferase family 4 protein [Methylobacterium sp. Leaf456]|uniref:glycosyltransferase family 4 protein n=1 Tax=Methylobacterium sp. Leaf456 TaxID=1736382 RepID=UPI0025707938|nr:glycosyltransferase family 4 protein [Methylobacterium sp. Leaf456]